MSRKKFLKIQFSNQHFFLEMYDIYELLIINFKIFWSIIKKVIH